MATPNLLTGSQYYKVGDWVTFGWNFTSMQIKPSAVNVLATCSQASALWTIAANASYETSMKVLWDTNQYKTKQTPQLVMATYTLLIENANEAVATAIQHPGQLGTVNSFQFGMYLPQPYVPYSGEFNYGHLSRKLLANDCSSDFNCPTCNGASTLKQTFTVLFGMASITILSFTWFATGRFGVF
jgi:hypothetical protein